MKEILSLLKEIQLTYMLWRASSSSSLQMQIIKQILPLHLELKSIDTFMIL